MSETNDPLPPKELDALLAPLYRLDGVLGACLQSGREVLSSHLPFSDRRCAEFALKVDAFCAGYGAVDREVRQFCVGFEESWLLVVTEEPLRLGFLVEPGRELGLLAGAARRFLADHPELRRERSLPVASANGHERRYPAREVSAALMGLLSKVMGMAQAQRLVEREVQKLQVDPDSGLTPAEAAHLGAIVLEKVPNRWRRESLMTEFRGALGL